MYNINLGDDIVFEQQHRDEKFKPKLSFRASLSTHLNEFRGKKLEEVRVRKDTHLPSIHLSSYNNRNGANTSAKSYDSLKKSLTAKKDSSKEVYRLTPLALNIQTEKLFRFIEENESGNDTWFNGAYGQRKYIYADYTASGRPLEYMECFIRNQVMSYYENIHRTERELQTAFYRDETRSIIKKCVNANDEDLLIFTQTGATAAIYKLIDDLQLSNGEQKLIVFVSPYEYNANLLIWQDLASEEVVTIKESENGGVDLVDLEIQLRQYSENGEYKDHLKIGCFSAVSKLTGMLTNTNIIAIIMHQYNGLAFFDYSAGAPYVKIDMNPSGKDSMDLLAYKDAIFISTHKFIGGPQTPGVLIAKKSLFKTKISSTNDNDDAAVATVDVNNNENEHLDDVVNGNGNGNGDGNHDNGSTTTTDNDDDDDESAYNYIDDIETRDEGGTPGIVESIRAGLVFQLKEQCGIENIMLKEEYYFKKAINYLKQIDNLRILGNTNIANVNRLPIVSFLIEHKPSGRYLHPKFVSALLRDLFGIETRNGCACAGPYAIRLLSVQQAVVDYIVDCIKRELEVQKPGFTRLFFTYFMSEQKVDFILNAIKFISKHGWKFIQYYRFNIQDGNWSHNNSSNNVSNKFKSINEECFNLFCKIKEEYDSDSSKVADSDYFEDCFKKVNEILRLVNANKIHAHVYEPSSSDGDTLMDSLWFLTPIDSYHLMNGREIEKKFFF